MESFSHQLQKFDPGIVWLDAGDQVSAMNGVAARVLGVNPGEAIGREITQFHPIKSREKVRWLLNSGATCPMDSPPPMTMLINIPDRVLMIKVSKMLGTEGGGAGTCMVFYDLTSVTTEPAGPEEEGMWPRRMFKIPVYRHSRLILLDLGEVLRLESDGHYTSIHTMDGHYLCNLSLSDLEARLDPQRFLRVHRRHMVNIDHAREFWKEGNRARLYLDGYRDPVPVSRSKERELREVIGME
ncbi:LytTR family DNA-binding domain-containing protein [Thiohalorhabdus sp. Cl-TMA]|uniref:LytTR family transcriptional regulator DNA-binding domain-containing protein n=1 Tax=Thiohalorhabdus methylotrophus TaxID=3242694 RepID=A0ABV4TS17_9GAMM